MKESRQHEILALLWILFGTVPPTSTFVVILCGFIGFYHLIASLHHTFKERKEKKVE